MNGSSTFLSQSKLIQLQIVKKIYKVFISVNF